MQAIIAGLMLLAIGAPAASRVLAPDSTGERSPFQVVVLGTGTPLSDPGRSGPAIAFPITGGIALVDAGPGAVRQLEAAHRAGTLPFGAAGVSRIFLTHLHSDHTLGLAELMLAGWVLGRHGTLHVYGPPGTRRMVRHLLAAYEADIVARTTGLEGLTRRDLRVEGHDVRAGQRYVDSTVTVSAFEVPHANWLVAFGYRLDAAGHSVVISGDTRASDAVVAACHGCDILVHEVYSAERLALREPRWQRYHANAHTGDDDVGRLAERAGARSLVFYHQLYFGATDSMLVAAAARNYKGPIHSARDLDVLRP